MTLKRVNSKEIGSYEEVWDGFLLGFRMERMRTIFQMERIKLLVKE